MIESIWYQMSAMAQDALLLIALLLWPLLIFGFIQWRYRVMSVVSGFLRNHSQASLAMVILIAIATAINILFSIQENAVRSGTARVSDHFDLIIAAPGSQVDALLSTVFLQASTLLLMSSDILQSLVAHPSVDSAAPVALGDTIDGYPLVGTSQELIADLAGDTDATDFTETFQIIAGSETPAQTGDTLLPQHSLDIDDAMEHADAKFTIIRRLPPTGTPWDHAYMAPIEAVWQLHGNLEKDRAPVIVVKATGTAALYQLRQQYNSENSMAFFPAEVLYRLYEVLGSMTSVIKALTLGTQLLVVVAVLLGVFILMRSMATRFATLHALGAPAGFRFCLVWVFASLLILAGVLSGLLLGWLSAIGISRFLTGYLQLPVISWLSFTELIATAIFFNATVLLAVFPAWMVSRGQQPDILPN